MSPRASLRELMSLTRNLGVSLHSGIGIVKAFELATRKTNGSLHAALADVIRELKSGQDVTSSLEAHDRVFPGLMIDMVRVGETSGNLPEVLKSLSRHYENMLRLRRDFISQITMPVIQFVAAVLIIAGLIFLLGIVAQTTGQTIDVLGWGLVGTRGALIWLGGWAAVLFSLWMSYQLIATSLTGKQAVDRWLLTVPVIGDCLRSFAVARFSWAFSLTQGAGMPIEDSLETSLRATSNGAFLAVAPDLIAWICSGETLTEALDQTRLFPVEYMEFVQVAEQSGTVPEELERLGPHFEEDARRSLRALATALGWLIWLAVALFIIYLIFTLALWYVGMLTNIQNELGL